MEAGDEIPVMRSRTCKQRTRPVSLPLDKVIALVKPNFVVKTGAQIKLEVGNMTHPNVAQSNATLTNGTQSNLTQPNVTQSHATQSVKSPELLEDEKKGFADLKVELQRRNALRSSLRENSRMLITLLLRHGKSVGNRLYELGCLSEEEFIAVAEKRDCARYLFSIMLLKDLRSLAYFVQETGNFSGKTQTKILKVYETAVEEGLTCETQCIYCLFVARVSPVLVLEEFLEYDAKYETMYEEASIMDGQSREAKWQFIIRRVKEIATNSEIVEILKMSLTKAGYHTDIVRLIESRKEKEYEVLECTDPCCNQRDKTNSMKATNIVKTSDLKPVPTGPSVQNEMLRRTETTSDIPREFLPRAFSTISSSRCVRQKHEVSDSFPSNSGPLALPHIPAESTKATSDVDSLEVYPSKPSTVANVSEQSVSPVQRREDDHYVQRSSFERNRRQRWRRNETTTTNRDSGIHESSSTCSTDDDEQTQVKSVATEDDKELSDEEKTFTVCICWV